MFVRHLGFELFAATLDNYLRLDGGLDGRLGGRFDGGLDGKLNGGLDGGLDGNFDECLDGALGPWKPI